jgi:hypothetical protein
MNSKAVVIILTLLGLAFAFIGLFGMIFAINPIPPFSFFVVGVILSTIMFFVLKKMGSKEKEDTQTRSKEFLDSIDEV